MIHRERVVEYHLEAKLILNWDLGVIRHKEDKDLKGVVISVFYSSNFFGIV